MRRISFSRFSRSLLVAAVATGAVCAGGSGALAADRMAPPTPTARPSVHTHMPGYGHMHRYGHMRGYGHRYGHERAGVTCRAGALRARVLGSQGAAGSVYVTIGFANAGRMPCVLRGHPGVAFVGRFGRQIGAPADWTGGPGRPVRLAPGGGATFVVRYVQAGVQVGCDRPGTYRAAVGLRVYPPGSYHARFVMTPGARACVKRSVRQLSVGPVTG
jgi:hypothetical protein